MATETRHVNGSFGIEQLCEVIKKEVKGELECALVIIKTNEGVTSMPVGGFLDLAIAVNTIFPKTLDSIKKDIMNQAAEYFGNKLAKCFEEQVNATSEDIN